MDVMEMRSAWTVVAAVTVRTLRGTKLGFRFVRAQGIVNVP